MKHVLPLTYEPKILNVLSGKCSQTVRLYRRIRKGDQIMFHGWQGKPYRSKWSFRTPYWNVIEALPIFIFPYGISIEYSTKNKSEVFPWHRFDALAKKDGIDPPTGEQLCHVMSSMHDIPETGVSAQVIRWEYKPSEEKDD